MYAEHTAEWRILTACRKYGGFKTSGTWGMRQDVKLKGFYDTVRTPCAVLDLARTKQDPEHFGFNLPIVLASGETWEAVETVLIAAGELHARPIHEVKS